MESMIDGGEKPKEDFCVAEDGVVESFVAWDLGFSSQEALQREKFGFVYIVCYDFVSPHKKLFKKRKVINPI